MEKKKVLTCTLDDNELLGVQAISFVDVPAIMTDFIALRGHTHQIKLAEVVEEKRIVVGPLLIPDLHILRMDASGEEYYITFPRDVIYRTSQLYMQRNQQHNHTMMHQIAISGCTLVQTWTKESDMDTSVHYGFDVPDGTWMGIVKVDNPEVWEEIKAGRVRGFSVEAFYDMVKMSAEDLIMKEIEALL